MSDTVIRVENLSKKYIIRHQQAQRYTALRDVIADGFKSVGRRLSGAKQDPSMSSTQEEFWALKDVSFEVKQGDRVGIIGRNGAGKSTLLKTLSRITEPTTGEITLNGRVASLLEVGTGFHPELTGRENIFLNGAILGMGRAEIKKKFDEIVDFAEVEKFIDTPVKHYSSGMYVRLAFAVAAHLEPEILIVDEVLAVGDASFQKKCLGKMENVADKEGRTVLFVSHNMTAILALCSYGIFMEGGVTIGKQSVEEAINRYSMQLEKSINDINFPISNEEVTIHDFSVTQDGYNVVEYDCGKPIDMKICFTINQDLTVFRMGVFLRSNFGECIFRSLIADWKSELESLRKGKYLCSGQIPPNLIAAGSYMLELHSSRFGIKDYDFGDLIKVPMTFKFPHTYNIAHIDERTFGSVIINPNWIVQTI
jgi:lipopolysaccharide transport system ATP-binding protein